MKIPEKLFEKWQILKSEGDPIKISEKSGIHVENIRLALRKGECNDQVFEAIAEYYDSKAEMIRKYLQPIKPQ